MRVSSSLLDLGPFWVLIGIQYRTHTSSTYSTTYSQITAEFGVSRIVATLGLSSFIWGMGKEEHFERRETQRQKLIISICRSWSIIPWSSVRGMPEKKKKKTLL